jgi:hypothetical protein
MDLKIGDFLIEKDSNMEDGTFYRVDAVEAVNGEIRLVFCSIICVGFILGDKTFSKKDLDRYKKFEEVEN